MAFFEELLLGGSLHNKKASIGIDLKLKTKPWAEPIAVSDLKAHLGITHSVEDAVLALLISETRALIERVTGLCMMEQEWIETLDKVPVPYKLSYRYPLSISSVEYIPGWDADTELVFPSGSYILAGERIVPRVSWPYHRGFQSFKITYKAGYASKGAGDEAALTAARAAVDTDLILALKNLAAWMYENREGQGHEAAFKAAAEKGSLPPMVEQMLSPFIQWGF